MEKQELFSRFKDYKTEIEVVLENKNFSESAENLLLGMLYKIEASFKDYAKVRVDDRTKKEFVAEIIENIKENCNEIEVINLNQGKPKIAISKNKIVTYPNEEEILKYITLISSNKCNLPEEYSYLEKPLREILCWGKAMNDAEVIRDFDGWSWNIQKSYINNFEYNLIYQNLRILMGNKEVNMLFNEENCMGKIVESLKKMQKENSKIEVEKLFTELILGTYIHASKKNRNSLEQENMKKSENELNRALAKQTDEWQILKTSFQKIFLNYLLNRLKKINNKKDLLEFIYIFRYYLNIPLTANKSIKDAKELENEIENIFYIAIKQACNLKLINAVHEEPKINSEILKSIFFVKVIDLEDIQMEIQKKGTKIKVIICEKEAIDSISEMKLEQEEDLKLKFNKRIKIFN